ncbi:ankyrin repeat domain-containing protein [Salinisphaera sp. RV14]|uniref:ankyrin repeat domain-containing protein n=1 Tax=unclassified Salinisphaera TaxID=2649847 RepID=UPI003F8497D6
MAESIAFAVRYGDLVLLRKLLQNGVDPDTVSESGEGLIRLACTAWETNQFPADTVRLLLEAGAKPNHPSGGGCEMMAAIFNGRFEVVELLLRYGANPNSHVDGSETIYELAEFDYRYEQYGLTLPEEPTEQEKSDEDAWVAMLVRLAGKYAKRSPQELLTLRAYGAKTIIELNSVQQDAPASS